MKKIISFSIMFLFLISIVQAQREVLLFPNNEVITPDQPSYFMKVKVPEYFQLLFAKNKISKRLDFMEKRRLEYERLALKFNESEKKQEKLLEHLRMLESKRLEQQKFVELQFSTLSNERKLYVLEQLQKHQQRLNEVKEKLPEPAQQRITVAIESSGKVIQKFNKTTENIRQFEKAKNIRDNAKRN